MVLSYHDNHMMFKRQRMNNIHKSINKEINNIKYLKNNQLVNNNVKHGRIKRKCHKFRSM
jgi:hypothetical protein